MNATEFKCINCGMPLSPGKEDQFLECPSCGSKYLYDDGVKRSEHVYTDTAKVQREENRKLGIFENAERYNRNHLLIILFIIWAVTLIFICVGISLLN